jgi:hypothetical protein
MRCDGGGLLVPLRETQVDALLKDGLEFGDSALQQSVASPENDWQLHLMQPPAFSLPGLLLLHGGKREGVSKLCTSRESVFACEAAGYLTVRKRRSFLGPVDVLSRTAVWFEIILRRKQVRDEAVGSCDS